MSDDDSKPVVLEVLLANPAVALQLAQLCKRIGFEACFELTEAHLPKDERNDRTYKMLAGLDAVASALAKQGVAPR